MSDAPGLGLNEWLSRQIHACDCLVPGCLSDGNAATRAIGFVVAEAFLGLPLQERAQLAGIQLSEEAMEASRWEMPDPGVVPAGDLWVAAHRYVTPWEPK